METIDKGATQAARPPEFRELYERWFEDVSRWIRAMGGPEADREDLVQDVFMVVYRRLPDFDGENVAGWLYQIARRRVRDFLRLAWVKHLLLRNEPLSDALPEKSESPTDALDTKEKRQILETLLQKLNDRERTALLLFEVEGYSGEQIAALQGVAVGTIWVRIHNARRKLKLALAKYERKGEFHK